MVQVVHQREDGSRHRNAWLALVARIRPRLPEHANLARLLHMKGLTRFVRLECGALQVHPELRRPHRGRVGTRAPPDPITKSRGMRLEPKQPRRIREHWSRIRPRESFALQQLQQPLGVATPHVRIAASLRWRVAEMPPSLDHLLWRSATDPKLDSAVAYEVGRPGVLH